MYIAIEGIDTAGKSTQIALLKEAFNDAIITKEPGGTDMGTRIRDIVLHREIQSSKAEFLLFLADRAEHMCQVIEPNSNSVIISDRSVISGVAYALVKGDLSETAIVHMNRFATNGVYPSKVFLLQLTPAELEYRLSQKKLDGIEKRGTEYLLSIQEALVKAAQLLKVELVIIDATQSIEAISNTIITNIKEYE
ncbi:MAG: dTMP kinase [Campylobacterota bacterium]|nr:dTMP kinase [Campylobacterota bacterium]